MIDIKPTVEDWLAFASDAGYPEDVVEFVRSHPEVFTCGMGRLLEIACVSPET